MEYKKILKNGIRIVIEKVPHVYSSVVGFWIDIGSKNESNDLRGICHFIEHMFFKGTKNRSALELAQSLEDTGGSLNAFTDKENTCFFARVLDKYLPTAIDVISDMLLNSSMDITEIEKEKQVVIEEIKMYEDSPDDLVFDLFLQTFWSSHPLGHEITGSVETVKTIDRNKILNYMHNYYSPNNLVIAIAGNLDIEKVENQIISLLGDMSNIAPIQTEIPVKLNPGVFIKYKDIEQIHLCIGTKGTSITDKSRYTLAVIDTILGGGMSSRLFQEIREKRGLVYNIHSFQGLYRPDGVFGIYAGTSLENIKQVIELVLKEFGKIKNGEISPLELVKAKEYLKGGLLLSLEAVKNRMMRLARNELFFKRLIPIEEIIEDVDNVSLDDVIKMAQNIFSSDILTLAIVGPLKELPFDIKEMYKKEI